MDVMLLIGMMVALLLVVLVALRASGKKNKGDKSLPKDAYVSKPFLTNRERQFFYQARTFIPDGDIFMAQVRLVDLVDVNKKYCVKGNLRLWLFRKISQWHCDFVWLDPQLTIKAVVELDDASHRRKDRVRRDKTFNQVMAQAGIRVLRVNSFADFTKQVTHCDAL